MSEDKFTVVKFTTHDGEEFYSRIPETEIEDRVRETVRRTHNVYRVDILEMNEAEYSSIPVTSDAVAFFGAQSAN